MDSSDDEVIEIPRSYPPKNSSTLFSSKIRILAVDDDSLTRVTLQSTLTTAGYKAVFVKGAKQALDIFNEGRSRFDLLLTDVHMTNMNGFQLLEIVKREFRIPVVMMSSDHSAATAKEGLDRGAVFFYPKTMLVLYAENLCQHVYNDHPKNFQFPRQPYSSSEDKSNSLSLAKNANRREKSYRLKKKSKEDINSQGENLSSENKSRMIWTSELHDKFEKAIQQLGGFDNAIPAKILQLMGVKGLKRTHISSHLQKCRHSIKARCNGGISENVQIGSSSDLVLLQLNDPWLTKCHRRRRLLWGAKKDPWISRAEEGLDPWLTRNPASVRASLHNETPQEAQTDLLSSGLPGGLHQGEQKTLLPNQPESVNNFSVSKYASPFPTQFQDDKELPKDDDSLVAKGSGESSVPVTNMESFFELLMNDDDDDDVLTAKGSNENSVHDTNVESFLELLANDDNALTAEGNHENSVHVANEGSFLEQLLNTGVLGDMSGSGYGMNPPSYENDAGIASFFLQIVNEHSHLITAPTDDVGFSRDCNTRGDVVVNQSGTTIGELLTSFNKQLDEETGFLFMAEDDTSSMASNNPQIMPSGPGTEQQEVNATSSDDLISDLRDAIASLPPTDDIHNPNQGNTIQFEDPDDLLYYPMWFAYEDNSTGI